MELYNDGSAAELERLSHLLNELMADLSLMRAALALPQVDPKEGLEMVNKDRLDKEGLDL
jgi:hypothetical protein